MTLFWLDEHLSLPPKLVAQAIAAGDSVHAAPFDVAFDHAEIFPHHTGVGPLVLTSSVELSALRQLRGLLGFTLRKAGVTEARPRRFNPHMTLNYGACRAARQQITAIGWSVSEFVLIHSLRGQGVHLEVARWPLRSLQMGFDTW